MAPKCADASHSGGITFASVRTPDSFVWGNTKAIDLISSVRFSWNNHQNKMFMYFLETFGSDYKDADIEPLLFELGLHGYNDISNKHGQSVYRLIKDKVMRKLKRTADKMEPDRMFKPDIEPSTIDSKHNVFNYKRDSINPGVASEYINFAQPCYPFPKMPQQKVDKANLKNAIYEDSPYTSETSYTGPRTPRASHTSHPPSQKKESVMAIEEAKYKRARQSIRDLVFELYRTEEALKEAASAFSDLQPIKKGEKWTDVLQYMIVMHNDVQLDGSKFYEFSKKNL